MKVRFLAEAFGKKPLTTGKVLCNKAAYALARSIVKEPTDGWLHSRWHWFHWPFPLRGQVLWSPALEAWFCPEDESAMEGMLHLPKYEPVSWVAPERGNVFLDVGAYVGWYTIQASRIVGSAGRVIALEPDAANRRQLLANLLLNSVANATVFSLAAWSSPCQVRWHRGTEPVWRRVDPAQGLEVAEATTLDALAENLSLSQVDWIKMDIEGAEIEALAGAKNVLRTHRPALFVEVHGTLQPLKNLLEPIGYAIERAEFDSPFDRHGWILAKSKGRAIG